MDHIYKEVASETGEKVDLVEDVVRSMFSFISETMESGSLKPVRLMYLGIWMCRPKRVEILKEKGLL